MRECDLDDNHHLLFLGSYTKEYTSDNLGFYVGVLEYDR